MTDYGTQEDESYHGFSFKTLVGIVLVGIMVLVGGIVLLVGASLNRVAANEWGCLYGGGLETYGLKETIAPGKSGGISVFDTLITIPSDDRIYAIDDDPNTADFGGQAIIVPALGTDADSAGIVQVKVPVQARFTINENACELYQNYLKKYKSDGLNWNGTDNPSNPGGWAKFLNLQMNQTLITSIRSQISGDTYVELYTNFSEYPAIQKNVSTALGTSLRSSLGGDFFCGPSYVFDGDADGKLEGGGCPPIEIIIKVIEPVDPQFLNNLKTIVANQEQQKVIQSDKERAIAQTNADKERSLAQTEADKEKQLAQTTANRETNLAQAAADRAVQLAQAEKNTAVAIELNKLANANLANDLLKAQAETAFCANLAEVNVNCADYFKALNWKPNIILSDDANTNVLVNT